MSGNYLGAVGQTSLAVAQTIQVGRIAGKAISVGADLYQLAIEGFENEGGGLGAQAAENADQAAQLEPYSGPGGGHHVPAKSAFPGAAGYDPNKALAIPNAEMARLGVDHIGLVTPAQRVLYTAYAQTGASLTWEAVQSIETEALVQGGMERDMAQATVQKAIQGLKDAGVAGPTRIPWSGN
jgi:hypothetical protein